MFTVFAVFLLWRHYQNEFVYPVKLYKKVHKRDVEECMLQEQISKEACTEYHALYDVNDFKKGYRKVLAGHNVQPETMQISGAIRNYKGFFKLDKYHYERCLKILEKGAYKTTQQPESFCSCKIENLNEMATRLDPTERPNATNIEAFLQKAYDDARAACQN
tara:strand:+ start:22903 stop:23388 length:486 start_codon:yes stop_codon:yes gene_type:complete